MSFIDGKKYIIALSDNYLTLSKGLFFLLSLYNVILCQNLESLDSKRKEF